MRCSSSSSSCFLTAARLSVESVVRSTVAGGRQLCMQREGEEGRDVLCWDWGPFSEDMAGEGVVDSRLWGAWWGSGVGRVIAVER